MSSRARWRVQTLQTQRASGERRRRHFSVLRWLWLVGGIVAVVQGVTRVVAIWPLDQWSAVEHAALWGMLTITLLSAAAVSPLVVRELLDDRARIDADLSVRAAFMRWVTSDGAQRLVRRHRSRARQQREHFTIDEWHDLCERYNYCCASCGQRRPLTVDHVVPLGRGGTNAIHNLQPLCSDCNTAKGTQTIDYR